MGSLCSRGRRVSLESKLLKVGSGLGAGDKTGALAHEGHKGSGHNLQLPPRVPTPVSGTCRRKLRAEREGEASSCPGCLEVWDRRIRDMGGIWEKGLAWWQPWGMVEAETAESFSSSVER